MAEFRMPSLGADMESGKLVEWLVAPGIPVKRGDVVALVETQKGLFEIEVFEDGVLGEPLVAAGQTVAVGTVLALIHAVGVAPAESAPAEEVGTRAEQPAAPAPVAVPRPAAGPVTRVAASPSARRLAAELGVDLATVQGSGPHGVIGREDVERVAHPPAAEAAGSEPTIGHAPPESASSAMRKAIAAAVSRSNREIPHYYLATEINLSPALQWLESLNARRPIRERILPVVLLLKATARALRSVPELNGHWLDDRLHVRQAIHIGFAVALRQGGLVAPAIHDVDTLSLDGLMAAMADLIERARGGRLRGSELTEATVTVTNLGDRGVTTVFGVIYPPQVALVGFGRITERPWAEGGLLGVRRCLTATLAADHRATDGHLGGRFLDTLDRVLQQPEAL